MLSRHLLGLLDIFNDSPQKVCYKDSLFFSFPKGIGFHDNYFYSGKHNTRFAEFLPESGGEVEDKRAV